MKYYTMKPFPSINPFVWEYQEIDGPYPREIPYLSSLVPLRSCSVQRIRRRIFFHVESICMSTSDLYNLRFNCSGKRLWFYLKKNTSSEHFFFEYIYFFVFVFWAHVGLFITVYCVLTQYLYIWTLNMCDLFVFIAN